jgi:hypothetical protein
MADAGTYVHERGKRDAFAFFGMGAYNMVGSNMDLLLNTTNATYIFEALKLNFENSERRFIDT